MLLSRSHNSEFMKDKQNETWPGLKFSNMITLFKTDEYTNTPHRILEKQINFEAKIMLYIT